MPSEKEVLLSWLAGFLDGEGTIGISRTNSKNWKTPYLRPLIQVVNTDRRSLYHTMDIIETVTGKRPSIVVSNRGDTGNCSKAWRVKVHTQWELLLLIPALMPHLVLKKRQAELCLDFCKRRNLRKSWRWYDHKDLDEAGYNECIALNARGQKERKTAQATIHQINQEVTTNASSTYQ